MSRKGRSSWPRLANPPFAWAVGLLGCAAVLSGPVSDWMDVRLAKRSLPLRAPLGTLDPEAIAPYRIVKRHILESGVVEALGTDWYLSWMLEDTSVGLGDPLRYGLLFVTYYTGGPTLVPHTPDVCYLGVGYQRAQPHENMYLDVAALGAEDSQLPVRVCTFAKTEIFNRDKTSVVYTFHCNGRFAARRTEVRILLNDPGNIYAYFSKVEVSFPRADRSQTIEGARKLFDRVLPVLIGDHWPDFEEAEREARKRPQAAVGKARP